MQNFALLVGLGRLPYGCPPPPNFLAFPGILRPAFALRVWYEYFRSPPSKDHLASVAPCALREFLAPQNSSSLPAPRGVSSSLSRCVLTLASSEPSTSVPTTNIFASVGPPISAQNPPSSDPPRPRPKLSKRELRSAASFRRKDEHFRLDSSPIDHLGVFARQLLRANTSIQLDIAHNSQFLNRLYENIGPCPNPQHNNCWVYLYGDFGEYFNHSDSPNSRLEYDPISDVLVIRFLRDIRANEEVTIDYGPDYEFDKAIARASFIATTLV